MSDKIDRISNEVVNRKAILNKQLLTKVININLTEDNDFKTYLINGINNDDIHIIMMIKDYITLNK
jgi:hypothetical protein